MGRGVHLQVTSSGWFFSKKIKKKSVSRVLILSCFVLEKPLSGWKPVVFRIVLGEGGGDFLNPGDTKSDLHVWRPSEYLL